MIIIIIIITDITQGAFEALGYFERLYSMEASTLLASLEEEEEHFGRLLYSMKETTSTVLASSVEQEAPSGLREGHLAASFAQVACSWQSSLNSLSLVSVEAPSGLLEGHLVAGFGVEKTTVDSKRTTVAVA